MGLNKKEPFYVTTPIYYINDEPHIGHFYCTTAADVLARYHRLIGDDVFFATGTDENSQKVVEAAREKGIGNKEFIDSMADKWRKTWEDLNISFDIFIRTTTEEHRQSVEKLLIKCHEKGDIYKKEYEGLYCMGCERFLTEAELVDKKCPDHKAEPVLVREENYFFKLSKYEKPLLKLFEKDDFALPVSRRNEMIEFIKQGLQDISISRLTKGWGIPLPLSIDPNQDQVVYVWFDALINYITALGYYKDDEKMARYWDHSIHLVGKDIFRFHTIMWPAMLMSAGLKPPRQVFGHGFFTINGEKISKTLKNVIDPLELKKKYSADIIKYFILKEIPFGKDSDFSIKRLEERYTGDLSHDLGNLLNRALNMIEKYSSGMIPDHNKKSDQVLIHKEIRNEGTGLLKVIDGHYQRFEFSQILDRIWKYINNLNKYIDQTKPWVLKKEKKEDELMAVLYNCIEALRLIALYLYPIMPDTAGQIFDQIGIKDKIETLNYLKEGQWGRLKPGIKTRKEKVLFPPLEEKGEDDMEEKKIESGLIEIDDFKKVDLRVARILEAERVEGTDKLMKLNIDIGNEKRTLLAGIAQHYEPESLQGKKVIVIVNLKPRKMRGIESQGMLLAASDTDGTLSVLTVEKDIAEGSKIS
ncbi:MAG: methionine--tRNA ligase [Spirochaetes bacterium]|nr:methionine--tRNA ligase [Spirochaetota bacterium]